MADVGAVLPADENSLAHSNETPANLEKRELIDSIIAAYAAHITSNRRAPPRANSLG
jgi:hypothetical protein